MLIDGKHYRSIWRDGDSVNIIDQTRLPFEFVVVRLNTLDDACHAIQSMQVRGAPLIGATAAYGMALALREKTKDQQLANAAEKLLATRPTAVNLRWAIEQCQNAIKNVAEAQRVEILWQLAADICEQDIATNQCIGQHGLALLQALAEKKTAGTSTF